MQENMRSMGDVGRGAKLGKIQGGLQRVAEGQPRFAIICNL